MTYRKSIIIPALLVSLFIGVPSRSMAQVDQNTEETPELATDQTYGSEPLQAAFGYTEERNAYTGAQSSVKADEIDRWKGTSLKSAIRGKLAGWYNGVIRGESSPYASDPLVVLDGVPMPFLALEELDPTSVGEVTILKDAAAKALYGPQGAQGVVLITTKHGQNNSMKVNISANFSIEKPTKNVDMLNSYSQALLRNQALLNDGLSPQFTDAQLNAFRNGSGIDNDWRDIYMDDMFLQKYNVQVGAGSQRVRFYVNLGFSRETGRYKTVDFEKYNSSDYTNRFTVVSNLDVDVTSWLRAFANTNVRVQRINACTDGGLAVLRSIYATPNWVDDGETPDGGVITNEGYSKPIRGMINYAGLNMMTQTDLAAKMGLDLNLGFITKGLSFKGVFGYSSNYNGIRGGTHDYARYIYNDNRQEYVKWGSNVPTPLSWNKGTNTNYYIDIQAMLDYHRTFGDNSVDALVHYTAQDYRGSSSKWYTYAFILPTNRIELSGEARYGFKNRYFAQVDFNYAGSEMMDEGHQFHFSPTYSAAWVISEEAFLQENPVLTYLKLRASYGDLYYDSLRAMDSRYLYNNVYREGSGAIMGIYKGFGISSLRRGTADICWEKSKQQNYGLDLGLCDKFHLTFDYWRTKQSGVLLQSELEPVIGGITENNRAYKNAGKIDNNGVDLTVTYNTTLSNGLEINASGVLGWNKNNWTEANEISYADAGYAYPYRKTGESIGQKFGYLVDDSKGSIFWGSKEEIASSGLRFTGAQPRPGDLKFQDLNGDGVIDEGDYAPLKGVYNTPRLSYGFNVDLAYKGFDLYLDFIGESGKSALFNKALGVAEYVSGETIEGAYMPFHQNAWTAEAYSKGEKIAYPALSTMQSASLQDNSFFVSKLDYLRLRNLTLGYSLPSNIVSRLGMTRLRLYVGAQNLFTWDNMKFKGIDPEATNCYTKIYRSFNLGLNINF